MIVFNPIVWTADLIAIAVAMQTIELLALRITFSDQGIWSWRILKQDLKGLPWTCLHPILSESGFLILLWLRLFSAIGLIFLSHFALVFFILLSTVAIAVRWRGTFNGGSDYMTIIVLTGLSAQTAFPENSIVMLGSLYYIAIHCCASYTISGLAKLKVAEWRDGTAISAFVRSGIYQPPELLLKGLKRREVALVASWAALIFECTFPLALVSQSLCLIYLAGGLLFHLVNAYLFGLNRFFWVWAATYPALLWCSGTIG